MTPIPAGRKRHRVDIEARSGATADQLGSWAAVYSGVPCYVRPRNSRERYVADRPAAIGTHEVTLAYIAGLTTDMRLSFGGRVLLISGIVNVEEANRELVLDCTEGV